MAPRAALVALCILFQSSANGQPAPDLAETLRHIAQTYKAARSYELISEMRAPGKPRAGSSRVAVEWPDKYRIESDLTSLMEDPGPGRSLMVLDGSVLWIYYPDKKQYATVPAASLFPDAPGDLGDLRFDFLDRAAMGSFRSADVTPGIKFLRRETIDSGVPI